MCGTGGQAVTLHLPCFSGSQMRTHLLGPFKGLTREQCLLTADLLASYGIRLLKRAEEEEGREGLPKRSERFPCPKEGEKEKQMQIDRR